MYANNSQIQDYQKDKVRFAKHLVDRGCDPTFVNESFAEIEKLNRTDLYAEKNARKEKICLPLVIDTNPALPNMTKKKETIF